MYAVCVNFQLKPGTQAGFMPLMLANAQTSLRDEPDCRQFDVATDTNNPDAVFLYELYTNRAAFDVHLASAHFKTFDAAVTPMIADKIIQTWDTVQQ
jgi:quinol monooxygenase YgiN